MGSALRRPAAAAGRSGKTAIKADPEDARAGAARRGSKPAKKASSSAKAEARDKSETRTKDAAKKDKANASLTAATSAKARTAAAKSVASKAVAAQAGAAKSGAASTASGSAAHAKPKASTGKASTGKAAPKANGAAPLSKTAGKTAGKPAVRATPAAKSLSAKSLSSKSLSSKSLSGRSASAKTPAAKAPAPPKASRPLKSSAKDGGTAAPANPAAPVPKPAAPSPATGSNATSANPFLSSDVETFATNMARLWEAGGKAMAAYIGPRERGEKKVDNKDIVEIARTLGHVVERWASDPDRVMAAQRDFAEGFLTLWTGTLKRLSGEHAPPVVAPDPKDARFRDPEWTEHPVFDFLRQAYLQASRLANRVVDDVDDLDPHLRHKASFYVNLLANAASPSNFLPTNPELIRETIASRGENLVRGMTMLAEDIAAGGGDLRIRQTDVSGFEVGKNLATTPGKVVFRNDVFELIQYSPTTDMVRARPMLIVPPWINKFYVLDLTPEKSMIRWQVEQGVTVFCISWVNPDGRHATMGFDGYMRDGIMKAVDVAREICGTESVDTIGYCVGGTLLSVTLAYMGLTGDHRIASATLMTTQVDFTHAGDLKVFADEEQIAAVEAKMAEQGYLEGAGMANAFNLIRSNDMIFPYLVNNYLKGKAPFPFDLLYWNSDATRMPAANHSFYLRGCYLNNELARGRMEIAGETLDLSKVTIPIYELATREDHIAPPKSVYLGAQMFGGPVRFVLAGSGHIAGVVNPPAKMKYQYWVGPEPKGELQHWLDRAEEKPGSWWPDWRAWIGTLDATTVAARVPGEGKYKALCDAPGTYVKIRS